MAANPDHEKALFRARAERDVDASRQAPALTVPQALAQACRILAAEGHESGLAGQVTARADVPGQYWTLPFGTGLDEADPDRMVLVDDDLNPVDPSRGVANPATRFHLWVYRTRPDVRAIIHTHPPSASALAMIGEPLKVSHMDATMFADNCAYLPKWPGLPVADDEGRIISEALGDKQCILLAHHGLLTAGTRVQEACFLAVYMERVARLQLAAQAAGTIREIDPTLAREAGSFLRKGSIIDLTFAYWARRVGA